MLPTMNATPSKPDIATYQTELATAFARRRCACGNPAVCVAPGEEPVREAGILLRKARPDRAWCLRCVGLEKAA